MDNIQKPNEEIVPKTGKVVTRKVTQKNRSKAKKFGDLFLSEDIGNVKEYLFYDLLIPAIKDTIVDVIQKTTDMLFYGKVRGGSGRRSSGGTITSYNSMYTLSNKRSIASAQTARSRMMYGVDDLYFDDRSEAQTVLDVMCDIIDQYGKVTVADYYRACDVTGSGYTDNYYGWNDLRQAWIESTRNGYFINLPRPIDLKVERR